MSAHKEESDARQRDHLSPEEIQEKIAKRKAVSKYGVLVGSCSLIFAFAAIFQADIPLSSLLASVVGFCFASVAFGLATPSEIKGIAGIFSRNSDG